MRTTTLRTTNLKTINLSTTNLRTINCTTNCRLCHRSPCPCDTSYVRNNQLFNFSLFLSPEVIKAP